MSTVASPVKYTPDELLVMPDETGFELIDGTLVERKMGAESSYVGGTLFGMLRNHCTEQQRGWVFGADCGYYCFQDSPNTVRKPDVSFVRCGRFPDDRVPMGYIHLTPDLVAEVVSPGDLAYEINDKVEEFRLAGVRLIWVLYPETRTVFVHRADGSIVRLRENDVLTGEDVLPDFQCRIGDIFKTPVSATN